MTEIRVDPLQLLESAHKLAGLSATLAELAEETTDAATSAPSYDGQFGPQVQSMAGELQSMITTQAQRLAELTSDLRVLSEEFAKADHESTSGIAGLSQALREWAGQLGLLAEDGTLAWGPLSEFLLGLAQPREPQGPLTAPVGDGERPPWWGPLVQSVHGIWRLFDTTVAEPLRNTPETWRGNLYNARIIALHAAAQGWFAYDRNVNQAIYQHVETWENNLAIAEVIWNRRLWARQEPGLKSDGPITVALRRLSTVEASGAPVSVVGMELANLVENRGGVVVTFSDMLTGGGEAGVAPILGHIVLPERYTDPDLQGQPSVSAFIGHELAHVLQRDLPEFPNGYAPSGSLLFDEHGNFAPFDAQVTFIVGEFTLYMEVQSNIVQEAINYDFLSHDLARYPQGSTDYLRIEAQMHEIADKLATYTGPPADACAFVLQDHRGTEPGFYEGEMVREVLLGARIPPGGWQHWLSQQGFSNTAIEHISDIASAGTPEQVWLSGMLDYDWLPPVSEPSPTPTPMPTSTPTPSAVVDPPLPPLPE